MPLLLLPRELRDQIWIFVLRSPTGFINLPDAQSELEWGSRTPKALLKIEPYDAITSSGFSPPNDRIKLSLLRTCKQMHDECKGLLWHHNALVLQRSDDLSCLFWHGWPGLKRQLLEHLVHVQLDFNPFHMWKRNFNYLKSFLEIFATWSKTGALRKIDFKVAASLIRRLSVSSGYVYRSDMDTAKLFQYFCCAGTGGLAGVKRRLIVKQPKFDDVWETALAVRGVDIERLLDPQGVLMRLHNAMQGELWIDGHLYFQNGTRVGLGSDMEAVA